MSTMKSGARPGRNFRSASAGLVRRDALLRAISHLSCSPLRATALMGALILSISLAGVGLAAPVKLPRLLAPPYPDSVPAVQAKGASLQPNTEPASFGGVAMLTCDGHAIPKDGAGYDGTWCFLTKDPIEKVRAHYEKTLGKMHPMQGEKGERGYAVFLQAVDAGEMGKGYLGVSLHALAAPPAIGGQGYERMASWGATRHFTNFVAGVDWIGQEPDKRKPNELDALYAKHKALESAFFVRSGPDLEAADETLRTKYTKAGEEQFRAGQMNMVQSQMQAGMSAMQQQEQAPPEEDEEFNRIMKRKPELRRKYVALSQRTMTLMQQGKFEDAEKAADESDALIRSDPELAAWARKREQGEQQRSERAGKRMTAAEGKIRAEGASASDKALWGNWLEYLKDLEKAGHYYTLIVIDEAASGKGVNNDRAQVAAAAGNLTHQPGGKWDLRYRQSDPGAQAAAQPAAKPGNNKQVAGNKQPAPKQEEKKNDPVGDAAKKGMNLLRKLF